MVTWEATGGEISSDGSFVAGRELGSYTVTAAAGGISAAAPVTIAERGPTPPPPRPTAGKVGWTGKVPPQKWMTFYTKVLAKHATNPTLELTVSFEMSGEGADEADTKAALRELGLEGGAGVQ